MQELKANVAVMQALQIEIEGSAKNGNRYLAWTFVEAANFAVRYCEPARRFYQKKKAKRNSTVAIKAIAHKLARACSHMICL
jgi:transposase